MKSENKSILSTLIDNIITPSLPTKKDSPRNFLTNLIIISIDSWLKNVKWYKRSDFQKNLIKTLKLEKKILTKHLNEKSSLSKLIEESFFETENFDTNAQKAYFLYLIHNSITEIEKQIKEHLKKIQKNRFGKATLKEFLSPLEGEKKILTDKMKALEKIIKDAK